MAERGNQILAEALEPGGDRRLALAALRECRETLNALVRLSDPKHRDEAGLVDEAKLLAGALGVVIPTYPKVGRALADQLEGAGASDLAEAMRSLIGDCRTVSPTQAEAKTADEGWTPSWRPG